MAHARRKKAADAPRSQRLSRIARLIAVGRRRAPRLAEETGSKFQVARTVAAFVPYLATTS
jgi:hypothetical protein